MVPESFAQEECSDNFIDTSREINNENKGTQEHKLKAQQHMKQESTRLSIYFPTLNIEQSCCLSDQSCRGEKRNYNKRPSEVQSKGSGCCLHTWRNDKGVISLPSNESWKPLKKRSLRYMPGDNEVATDNNTEKDIEKTKPTSTDDCLNTTTVSPLTTTTTPASISTSAVSAPYYLVFTKASTSTEHVKCFILKTKENNVCSSSATALPAASSTSSACDGARSNDTESNAATSKEWVPCNEYLNRLFNHSVAAVVDCDEAQPLKDEINLELKKLTNLSDQEFFRLLEKFIGNYRIPQTAIADMLHVSQGLISLFMTQKFECVSDRVKGKLRSWYVQCRANPEILKQCLTTECVIRPAKSGKKQLSTKNLKPNIASSNSLGLGVTEEIVLLPIRRKKFQFDKMHHLPILEGYFKKFKSSSLSLNVKQLIADQCNYALYKHRKAVLTASETMSVQNVTTWFYNRQKQESKMLE